ncbi:unnamed protein product [Dracunculus medinensis]|uniref:CUPID domain-containing protein n=1 Tax=Dracunculus medinensis TaxID=318479 RepID=A0A0N4UCR3_DRAME|nr:unnamed protein product [Dracunculus medinensis]
MPLCTVLRQKTQVPTDNSKKLNIRDSNTILNTHSSFVYGSTDADYRIKQRLEASRQGILQLETLRCKHQKLMEEIRIHLPSTGQRGYSEDKSREKEMNREIFLETKLDELRCESPMSSCVSHRSSVSMDSGCVSMSSDRSSHSPMSYGAYRKISLGEMCKRPEYSITLQDENQRIVATAIESTTALRCLRQKPSVMNYEHTASACTNSSDDDPALLDSTSFAQLTPPPLHRKPVTVARAETLKINRPCYFARHVNSSRSAARDQAVSISHFVNRSPLSQSRILNEIPPIQNGSPNLRVRNSQKTQQTTTSQIKQEPQTYYASRVFVDRSPRNSRPRPKSMFLSDFNEAQEDGHHIALPAIVLSR